MRKNPVIAVLGIGLMGAPLAGRLLKAGYKVVVYNRTPAKILALKKLGALAAPTPAHALCIADVIVLMLADAAAIDQVLLNKHSLRYLKGKAVIQMGTIAPDESRAFAREVNRHGGEYLECPVLGSIQEAESGQLILMAGGRPLVFRRLRKILKCFGPRPICVGIVGKAAALKLALNQLIAMHITAFSQSLSLIQSSGVDVETFMNVVRQSALYAPMFDKKLPRLLKHFYGRPNFSTRHMLKDVRLFLKTANSLRVNASALTGVENILKAAVKKGFAAADYCSLFEIVREK